ncbi:hypothetical protein CN403_26365 [Bacillus cereus]|nr:hypothetical protein CN403_26365 [Bacillus cereus]
MEDRKGASVRYFSPSVLRIHMLKKWVIYLIVQRLKLLWIRWGKFWSQNNPVKEAWIIIINLVTTGTMWCVMTIGLVLCYWGYDAYYINEVGFLSRILIKVSSMFAIFIWIGVTYGIIRRYMHWNKGK